MALISHAQAGFVVFRAGLADNGVRLRPYTDILQQLSKHDYSVILAINVQESEMTMNDRLRCAAGVTSHLDT